MNGIWTVQQFPVGPHDAMVKCTAMLSGDKIRWEFLSIYIYLLGVLLSYYLNSSLLKPKINDDRTYRRRKTRSTIYKLHSKFSISITNIRGQWSNYPEVKLHLQGVRLDLFMPETGFPIPYSKMTLKIYIGLWQRPFLT